MKNRNVIVVVALLSLVVIVAGCSNDEPQDTPNSSASAPSIQSNNTYTDPVPLDTLDSAPVSTLNPDGLLFERPGQIMNVSPQTVAPGSGTMVINISMPYGYKLNESAPFQATILSNNQHVVVDDKWANYEQVVPSLPLEIPVDLSEGESLVTADLMIYWCEAINQTLCFVDHQQLNIPVEVDDAASSSTMNIELALVPPAE